MVDEYWDKASAVYRNIEPRVLLDSCQSNDKLGSFCARWFAMFWSYPETFIS
jgi:hypothetical protein